MNVSDLIEALQDHLEVHGDGPVCAETSELVADVVSVDSDRFTADENEPWSAVLVLDEDDD